MKGISQSKITHEEPKIIFDQLLEDLVHSGNPIDLKPTATPQRYRLVECKPLVSSYQTRLRICEFCDIPSVSYCTVSYVWRGSPISAGLSIEAISVKGAEHADPIATRVLQQACLAALEDSVDWLWIDRLCILQTREDTIDRNWQITKMYQLYKSCSLCLVIPGGLRRLASLHEETGWIHRGWTLQESLAPKVVKVLLEWTHGKCRGGSGNALEDGSGVPGEINEIIPGQSAVAPLWLILDASLSGRLVLYKLREPDEEDDDEFLDNEFDDDDYTGRYALWKTLEGIHLFGVVSKEAGTGRDRDFRFVLPNVAALALCLTIGMNVEADAKSYAIWKSALMRTSSRPVDMIFSIMALFDVILDVSQFHSDDRIGATIALTKEILKQPGGRANWLGLCFFAPPCRQLSVFPVFPQTAVAGKAMIATNKGPIEILRLMDSEYPNAEVLGPMPEGRMDVEGHFTFRAKSVRLARAINEEHHRDKQTGGDPWESTILKATNGKTWRADYGEEQKDTGETYAVLLGCFFAYTATQTLAYDCNNVRAMIVSYPPGPDLRRKKFHVVSYLMLSISAIAWAYSWIEREFCIAPNPDVEEDGEIEMYVPIPDKNSTVSFRTMEYRRQMDLARESAGTQ